MLTSTRWYWKQPRLLEDVYPRQRYASALLTEFGMADRSEPRAPDLTLGIAQERLADGATLLGHVGDDDVILARIGNEFFAVGTHCTHYHGPLAEGLVVDGTIRCPWHHACFDLRTGRMHRPPALNDLPCWKVEEREGRAVVAGKREESPRPTATAVPPGRAPASVLILG